MAYPVTLGTLSERALQRANMEGSSAFIKPYELVDLINGSIADNVRQQWFGWRGGAGKSLKQHQERREDERHQQALTSCSRESQSHHAECVAAVLPLSFP